MYGYACHEAGHCAALSCLGVPITRVLIHAKGGRVEHPEPSDAFLSGVITVTGPLAEMALGTASPDPWSKRRPDGDGQRLDRLLAAAGQNRDDLQRRIFAAGEQIIRSNRAGIEGLARLLLERGEVDGTTASKFFPSEWSPGIRAATRAMMGHARPTGDRQQAPAVQAQLAELDRRIVALLAHDRLTADQRREHDALVREFEELAA